MSEGVSVAELLAEWDEDGHAAGESYVYAFRDSAGSVFHIGKGMGDRGDKNAHRLRRLGYYIAKFLDDTYSVEVLKSGLSNDDVEDLEAWLIERLGGHLVNWGAAGVGGMLTTEAVARMRDAAISLRTRAREQAAKGDPDSSVALCRQALRHLSEWEHGE